MLAKLFKKRHIDYPCYIQPKLDGVRALWLGDRLQSRSYGRDEEIVWNEEVLPHIFKSLRGLPNCWLDGELYHHGWSRQKINSVARVKSNKPHHQHQLLYYHVFDLISDEPFSRRQEKLQDLAKEIKNPLFLVDTVFCHSEHFGDMCYRNWKKDGYEGAIYRDMHAHYGFLHDCPNMENRWTRILKRKDRLDIECECIGIKESEKFDAIQEPHIASLELRTAKGVIFYAGSGLSRDEKIRFMENPPLGCIVHISYDSLSEAYVPIQPSVEVVYV